MNRLEGRIRRLEQTAPDALLTFRLRHRGTGREKDEQITVDAWVKLQKGRRIVPGFDAVPQESPWRIVGVTWPDSAL